jgi:uncharacterized protein (DUF488 family)
VTRLLTVGHGTLAADEFASLLTRAGVAMLVDVRSYPGSRRHPQFGREAMDMWVPDARIEYRWEQRLGGRRRPHDGSRHVALVNDAFRAYADYMESDEFRDALDEVLGLAASTPTAVMCAESLWWNCHRRLLSDAAVLTRDAEVVHVMHDGKLVPHRVTDGARADDGGVVYDVGVDRPLA